MGERGDIIRTMQRAMSGRQRDPAVFQARRGWPRHPRPRRRQGASRRATRQRLSDRRWHGWQGATTSRCHRARSRSSTPIGAVVEVKGAVAARAADRNIASLAVDGVYRADHHSAVAQGHATSDREPREVVAAHVRRLEALRPHTDAVRGVIDRAFADLGCIDIVVSNAGYGLFDAAEEVSDEQVRHQIDTNLIGSIAVIRASLPHLRAQGGGRVLQVSSEGGQITYPGFSLYHATKWGIEGFVEAVAKEVAPFGILFTLVEPGPTGTNFGAGLVRAQPMEVYEGTPVGGIRDVWAKGEFKVTGDADKMVDAMITASDSSDPPLRLTLGSIAYVSIHKALNDRLAVLGGLKDDHSIDRRGSLTHYQGDFMGKLYQRRNIARHWPEAVIGKSIAAATLVTTLRSDKVTTRRVSATPRTNDLVPLARKARGSLRFLSAVLTMRLEVAMERL